MQRHGISWQFISARNYLFNGFGNGHPVHGPGHVQMQDRLHVQLRRQEADLKKAHNTLFAYEAAFVRGIDSHAATGSGSAALSLLRRRLVQLEKKQHHTMPHASPPSGSLCCQEGDVEFTSSAPAQSVHKLAVQQRHACGGEATPDALWESDYLLCLQCSVHDPTPNGQ